MHAVHNLPSPVHLTLTTPLTPAAAQSMYGVQQSMGSETVGLRNNGLLYETFSNSSTQVWEGHWEVWMPSSATLVV